MFEQAVFAVENQQAFQQLSGKIDAALAANRADLYLASVAGKKLRIRQFQEILAAGLLGKDAPALYSELATGDQALIREKYLAAIEKVPNDLRQRFLKLYVYY
ncbi:MAG TPA: hypothetical protein VL346_02610 [Acidobacteriaceae bacterium]|nr:hypothetical protein [Acidobacteriaceae bacterium]